MTSVKSRSAGACHAYAHDQCSSRDHRCDCDRDLRVRQDRRPRSGQQGWRERRAGEQQSGRAWAHREVHRAAGEAEACKDKSGSGWGAEPGHGRSTDTLLRKRVAARRATRRAQLCWPPPRACARERCRNPTRVVAGGPESDLDLLVTMDPGRSLLDLVETWKTPSTAPSMWSADARALMRVCRTAALFPTSSPRRSPVTVRCCARSSASACDRFAREVEQDGVEV